MVLPVGCGWVVDDVEVRLSTWKRDDLNLKAACNVEQGSRN